MTEPAVQAVIFDFDGVICQTEVYKLSGMAAMLEAMGLKVELKELYRLAGGTHLEKEAILDEIFGSQKRYWEIRDEVLGLRPAPFPHLALRTEGIVETLSGLKQRGICLAVASNSGEERLRRALKDCQVLEYFYYVISAFDLGKRKPDPFVYLYAMERMGVAAESCVIVEDSALGIRAGKAAGARVAALQDRDRAIDQSEADVILRRISQLFEYLAME